MIRVGIIGYGYWGPQIVRNFHTLGDCQVAVVCDKIPAAQQRVQRAYPDVRVTGEVSEVICSPQMSTVSGSPTTA